jgi:alanine racemase
MLHSSYIELNKSALINNVHFIKTLLPSTTQLSAVVKGNAYGHGIESYIPIAEEAGINHFSVYKIDEALRVFKTLKNKATILIMGFIDLDEMTWAIENEIEFFVYDDLRLLKSIEIAKKIGKKAIVHLEIETGLNRTGYQPKNINRLSTIIEDNKKFLNVKGICSHLAGAESISNYLRIKNQISSFNKSVKAFEKKGISFEQKHLACSAAIINYPKTKLDLVRVGIMQYGLWSSKETLMCYSSKYKATTDPLKRVISWKSKIANIKEVKSGEFVGYGTTFMAEGTMKIALIPVGYSDGYSRSLSNQGRVLVNGIRASVVGIINMNSIMIDITLIPDVKIGDEVVLIGNQDEMDVSIASFSELSNLLNYELLTRIPSEIPRYIKE